MDEFISKSQKKLDALNLQKIGTKLIKLPSASLDKIPLSDALRQAIDDAKTIKGHGAVRRQAQLIGKLMCRADHEAIIEAYNLILAEGNAQTAAFHDLEYWRDKLIQGDKEALTEFINLHPTVDAQHLRQLILKAAQEIHSGKSTGAATALFRFLRQQFELEDSRS